MRPAFQITRSRLWRLPLFLAIFAPFFLYGGAGGGDIAFDDPIVETGATDVADARDAEPRGEGAFSTVSRTEEFLLYRLTSLGTRNAGSPVQISEFSFFLDGA